MFLRCVYTVIILYIIHYKSTELVSLYTLDIVILLLYYYKFRKESPKINGIPSNASHGVIHYN